MPRLKLLLLSLIIGLPFFFLLPGKVLAIDCQIANWDPNTRSLQVCVGGFSSPTALRAASADFYCLDNSNPGPGLCTGVSGGVYSLSSSPDDQIAQDSSGKYYTCLTGQGLSRGIGEIEVRFTSPSGNCTTASINTVPADWDPVTEGTIFSGEPGRSGTRPVAVPVNLQGDCADGEINTAIGCIPVKPAGFFAAIIPLALGLGGALALLLMLYGFFILTTSAGIPDKVKAGQEIITSAVGGLIFIIFSVILLNLIGIKILGIPGLE